MVTLRTRSVRYTRKSASRTRRSECANGAVISKEGNDKRLGEIQDIKIREDMRSPKIRIANATRASCARKLGDKEVGAHAWNQVVREK